MRLWRPHKHHLHGSFTGRINAELSPPPLCSLPPQEGGAVRNENEVLSICQTAVRSSAKTGVCEGVCESLRSGSHRVLIGTVSWSWRPPRPAPLIILLSILTSILGPDQYPRKHQLILLDTVDEKYIRQYFTQASP